MQTGLSVTVEPHSNHTKTRSPGSERWRGDLTNRRRFCAPCAPGPQGPHRRPTCLGPTASSPVCGGAIPSRARAQCRPEVGASRIRRGLRQRSNERVASALFTPPANPPARQIKVSGNVNGSLTEALVSSKALQTCRGNLHNKVIQANQHDWFSPTFIDNCSCSSPTANALAHLLLAIT